MSYVFKNFFGNWYRKNPVQEIEISMLTPKNLDDAQKIVDCLINKIPVVVSFENTEQEKIPQILDYIHGKVYAVEGKMEQVGQKVFLFAPENIEIEDEN